MLITDYLQKEFIKIYLDSTSKELAINELLDLIVKNNPDIDKEIALRGLLEREKIESTAIGKGIAIPHARLENIDKINMAIGILQNPADFNSLDNMPVKLVFLILFPKHQISLQLRLLARISRLLHDTCLRDSLIDCRRPEDVINSFKNYEDKHFH